MPCHFGMRRARGAAAADAHVHQAADLRPRRCDHLRFVVYSLQRLKGMEAAVHFLSQLQVLAAAYAEFAESVRQ